MTPLKRRLDAIEKFLMPGQDRTLIRWLATLTDDEIDTLAEAAVAVKAGNTLPTDPATMARLNDGYAAFKGEIRGY